MLKGVHGHERWPSGTRLRPVLCAGVLACLGILVSGCRCHDWRTDLGAGWDRPELRHISVARMDELRRVSQLVMFFGSEHGVYPRAFVDLDPMTSVTVKGQEAKLASPATHEEVTRWTDKYLLLTPDDAQAKDCDRLRWYLVVVEKSPDDRGIRLCGMADGTVCALFGAGP